MIVVACHDAGGAEMVSAWVRQKRLEGETIAVLDGPALDVFARKLPGVPVWNEPWLPFEGVRLVLCGTSGDSPLEVFTWRMAKVEGVRTAAFLDGWKNYRVRFLSAEGGLSLPDEVWVTDDRAAAIARSELPGANVLVKGNPYVRETLDEIALREEDDERLGGVRVIAAQEHILVVYGPAAEQQDVVHLGPERWEPGSYVIRHRPHPADAPSERSLAEDVGWADIVVGYDSMAMYAAKKAGRRVLTALRKGEEPTIPRDGIERLYE